MNIRLQPNLHRLALAASLALGLAAPAFAHCDGLDGPVVTLARSALEQGRVEPVLAWVPASAEQQIRDAFAHTLAVRKLSPEARTLADNRFFETLVRVHRASEGAPYTGLKSAGRDLGPAIAAADAALAAGSTQALEPLLDEAVRHGLHERFPAVMALRDHAPGDIEAGRRYVAAYVAYVHHAEALRNAATAAPERHFPEPSAAARAD